MNYYLQDRTYCVCEHNIKHNLVLANKKLTSAESRENKNGGSPAEPPSPALLPLDRLMKMDAPSPLVFEINHHADAIGKLLRVQTVVIGKIVSPHEPQRLTKRTDKLALHVKDLPLASEVSLMSTHSLPFSCCLCDTYRDTYLDTARKRYSQQEACANRDNHPEQAHGEQNLHKAN